MKQIAIDQPWENTISINPKTQDFEVVYLRDLRDEIKKRIESQGISDHAQAMLNLDKRAIPMAIDREGYHGGDHVSYWLSGYKDLTIFLEILKLQSNEDLDGRTHLDLGSASGRFLRHLLYGPDLKLRTIGCDINSRHVTFMNTFLSTERTMYFQNTSIPHLPLPDNSIDFITAYSVFSHIDVLDTAWMMEFRRVLKDGGLAVITYHPIELLDKTSEDLPFYRNIISHPEWEAFNKRQVRSSQEKVTFRWRSEISYSANVFLSENYINSNWGRILKVLEHKQASHGYQSICLMRKQ